MKEVVFDEIQALFAEECICGKRKSSGRSFCYGCYRSLSPELQSALYRRSGNGYEEAVARSVESLGLTANKVQLYAEKLEAQLKVEIAQRQRVESEEKP